MLKPWATYDFYSKKNQQISRRHQQIIQIGRYIISLGVFFRPIDSSSPSETYPNHGPLRLWLFQGGTNCLAKGRLRTRQAVSCGWIPGNSSGDLFWGWLSDPFNSYVTLQLGDLCFFVSPFFLFFFRLVSLPIVETDLHGYFGVQNGTKFFRIRVWTSSNPYVYQILHTHILVYNINYKLQPIFQFCEPFPFQNTLQYIFFDSAHLDWAWSQYFYWFCYIPSGAELYVKATLSMGDSFVNASVSASRYLVATWNQ